MNTRPVADDIVADAPLVEIVSQSHAHWSTIEKYLDRIDQQWEHDGSTRVADILPEFAGRLCYQSFASPRPGGSEAYFDRIKSEKHGSVLEHVNVGILITGVSRNLTHELVRHRAGFSYSQLSQRYVDSSAIRFVPPYEFWDDEHEIKDWRAECQYSRELYTASVVRMMENPRWKALTPTDRRKHVRQAARSLLPGCAETHILVTGNLRAWRHFLCKRGAPGADTEIRLLALRVAELLVGIAPLVMSDIRTVESADGAGCLEIRHLDV